MVDIGAALARRDIPGGAEVEGSVVQECVSTRSSIADRYLPSSLDNVLCAGEVQHILRKPQIHHSRPLLRLIQKDQSIARRLLNSLCMEVIPSLELILVFGVLVGDVSGGPWLLVGALAGELVEGYGERDGGDSDVEAGLYRQSISIQVCTGYEVLRTPKDSLVGCWLWPPVGLRFSGFAPWESPAYRRGCFWICGRIRRAERSAVLWSGCMVCVCTNG